MTRGYKGRKTSPLHFPISGIQMEQKYKVHSLLPHRRSWGSGRSMCTWTANSIQIPPAIQRYIPINVQRNDSNSSEDWVMGVAVAQVPLPAFFRVSSRRRGRRRRNILLGKEQSRWERWASGRVTKTSYREDKSGGDIELRLFWATGLPFYGRSGCNGHLTQPGYLVWPTWSLTMVSPWGLGGVSVAAEEEGKAALRRHTVVALKRMTSNGLKNRPRLGEEWGELSVSTS
jgi:hypothetical protein